MRCDLHCPKPGGSGAGLGVLAAVVVVALVTHGAEVVLTWLLPFLPYLLALAALGTAAALGLAVWVARTCYRLSRDQRAMPEGHVLSRADYQAALAKRARGIAAGLPAPSEPLPLPAAEPEPRAPEPVRARVRATWPPQRDPGWTSWARERARGDGQ